MSDVSMMQAAAKQMRAAHGPEHKRHHMWAAMADMIDVAALERDKYVDDCPDMSLPVLIRAAKKTAKAFLNADSS